MLARVVRGAGNTPVAKKLFVKLIIITAGRHWGVRTTL
jgi:hypothetical protein